MEQEKDRSYDEWLGGQVRLYRKLAGMTQRALGESVGVSFQQIQKYENGLNRLSVSVLVKISESLNISISQLLDLSKCDKRNEKPDNTTLSSNNLTTNQQLLIAQHYGAIADPAIRRVVGELVKVLGRG